MHKLLLTQAKLAAYNYGENEDYQADDLEAILDIVISRIPADQVLSAAEDISKINSNFNLATLITASKA